MPSTVYFHTIKEDGSIGMDYTKGYYCFAPLTLDSFSKEHKEVIIRFPEYAVPYNTKEVKTWVRHMNIMGFPCEYTGIKENSHFFKIVLADYKYKVHLASALIILRYLYEEFINILPAFYFKLLKAGKRLDKFKVLQLAHIKYSVSQYVNTNHTVRNSVLQGLYSKKELFNRINTDRALIYSNSRSNVSDIWKGTSSFAPMHGLVETRVLAVKTPEEILKEVKLIK